MSRRCRGGRPPARLADGDGRRGRLPRRDRPAPRPARVRGAEPPRRASTCCSRNELSLMALTTFLHFCLDAIVERRGAGRASPTWSRASRCRRRSARPPAARCVLDVRARGAAGPRRPGRRASPTLREAEAMMRPARGSGRGISSWRSRLALALPEEERRRGAGAGRGGAEPGRASRVAAGRRRGAARPRPAARRRGGDRAAAQRSVERAGDATAPLEPARSLTELGAALRRGNQRREARERLREAADLAQRCGAERLEERIEEEIRVAGGKPRRRAVSGPDSLTPSEQPRRRRRGGRGDQPRDRPDALRLDPRPSRCT